MPFCTFGLMKFLFHTMLLLLNKATLVLSQPERSQVLDLLQDYLLHHHHHNHHHLSQKVIIPIPAEDGLSIAYLFQGMNRSVAVSNSALHNLRDQLDESKSFTFITAIRQERKNVGSILSLGNENERFLELESSGWRRELRLHYVHRSRTRTETFSSCDVITDGRWHRLAVSVIGATHVTVFIDCELRFQRHIPEMDLKKMFAAADEDSNQLRLWIGQRNTRHVSFKGAMEYLKVVTSVNGHLEQCPQANVECPSCAQFQQLQQSVQQLQSMVLELTKQVERSNRRILELEKCECRKQCNVSGRIFSDGDEVPSDERCTLCKCKNGKVFCEVRQCPVPNCKHPVTRKNDCCPICLKHCILKLGNEGQQKLDHGEEFTPRPCIKYRCNDGKVTKIQDHRRLCPRLSCPKEKQIKVEKECCKFCSGTNWCLKNANLCPQNSTCVSLETNFTCSCDRGFTHVGKLCQDVDECKGIGDRDGHHCRLAYSRCVNTVGSYHCECLPGYTKDETDDDQFSCRKIDFCEGVGRNACSPHAQCIDAPGSFTCKCNEGYEGNGFECTPICREPCQNGGTCVDVGQCSCRQGYRGRNCDTDIDECSVGIASCHAHSVCVNTPGSYDCRCKDGYHSNQPDTERGALCRDLDECLGWGGGQHCPSSAVCHNSNGSYSCLCAGNSTCAPECSVDGKLYRDGETWQPEDDSSCLQCQCEDGRVSCQERFVNCRDGDDDDDDCCEVSHSSCRHQDLPLNYTTGQKWNYRCNTCQCYAGGNVDCWPVECPKLKCPHLVYDKDQCCPRCSSHPDPCSSSSRSSSSREPHTHPPPPSETGSFCLFQGRTVEHQQSLRLDSLDCSFCQCLSGSICCSYNQTCAEHIARSSSPPPTQDPRSIRERGRVTSRPRARTRHDDRRTEEDNGG